MNPYLPPAETFASPYAPAGTWPGAPDRAAVTETTVAMLRMTRPWVQLLGVLTLLGAAFMLLGAVSVIGLAAFAPRGSATMILPLVAVYVPLAFVYVYPGLKLWRYGSAIHRLVASRDAADLEAALGEQKSFWKFVGIAAIVMVVLYILFFVGMMAVGVLGASRHGSRERVENVLIG